MTDARPIDRLIAVMACLRSPVGGCPWDLEQTFATIAPYTIEEAYEVADAIARGDMTDLREELGDLLLQVVYHARMAEEAGLFGFENVAEAVSDKMVRRHPHVFGEEEVADAAQQTDRWEAIKAAERAGKADKTDAAPPSVLDGIAVGLPALTRARKLGARAARVGFDFPALADALGKLEEEFHELKVEIEAGQLDKARAELGDVLFACADIARKLDIEPEEALRATNEKFTRRFQHVERRLAEQGVDPKEAGLERMDALWTEAKLSERR